MVTAPYAKELAATPFRVYAANPGYCATDLNARRGFRSAAEGAEVCARLALVPDDGAPDGEVPGGGIPGGDIPDGALWGYRWGEETYGELAF
jgi:NAD(P)-dependent dehydrogenase (short-subunit alcohol dehydrogenase family)